MKPFYKNLWIFQRNLARASLLFVMLGSFEASATEQSFGPRILGIHGVLPLKMTQGELSQFKFPWLEQQTGGNKVVESYSYKLVGKTHRGAMTPLAPVNVDAFSREHILSIPAGAHYYAWLYPIYDVSSLPDPLPAYKRIFNALKSGGYAYFDAEMKLIGINGFDVKGQNVIYNRIEVDLSRDSQDPKSQAIQVGLNELYRGGRFQDVTIQAISALGVSKFAWIHAGEVFDDESKDIAPYGAYAYRRADGTGFDFYPICNIQTAEQMTHIREAVRAAFAQLRGGDGNDAGTFREQAQTLATQLGNLNEADARAAAREVINQVLDRMCQICRDDDEDAPALDCKIRSCGHRFHKACILVWVPRQHNCPLCRGRALMNDLEDIPLQ